MNAKSTTGLNPAGLLAVAGGGWGYAEAEWVDGWHLRASDGFTHRANSAWPITGSREPVPRDLPHMLRAVHAWYAERGLPALVQCAIGSELDYAIDACGYERAEQAALRQSGRVSTVLDRLGTPSALGASNGSAGDSPICMLTDRPDSGWLNTYRAGVLPPVAGQVLGAGDDNVRFGTITDAQDGSTLAIGRVALATAPGGAGPARWAGLAAIETTPAARRRGLAKIVIRTLADWADQRGASHLYLEVTSANTPALALYRSLGFETHHAYHYRVIESRDT